MSDKDAATPRVFLIRHGETEWSRNGRYTGVTDIPLLPEGEAKIQKTASVVFGPGRLIDTSKIGQIFCSPRLRARRTLEILLEQVGDPEVRTKLERERTVTDDLAEWGYGDYEGLYTQEIRELRKTRGLDQDQPWDIWRDGTEGEGCESPQQVAERLDRMISKIARLQGEELAKQHRMDIVVVAHGHILRAFVKRWLGLSLESKLELMLEPGGVCGLSYAHGSTDARAVLVGMSFPGFR
ncbi:uncharacterized protein A1O9_08999 [Exophiala aquamarina CBS 119918]|uniref:2,3-bisphosphoglycerate-dependent phosphoglycerate mutase n=1 Tax=Exophiala aquamarina CBS 119918 TaxID=1182545 RepID=A0A072P4C2_9EURO|nr:uncharacterized protein A1O9_08999 [Exophiala aquamarina CBS 119918]KEF54557.1 hypothetical protein A1O9_08999 [Exophiala aquamarina CBS 119918]